MPQPDPGAGQVFGIRLTGFLACFARRTYYFAAVAALGAAATRLRLDTVLAVPAGLCRAETEPLGAELEAGRAPKRVGADREAADAAEEKSAAQSN